MIELISLLRNKLYFTVNDISELLSIKQESAWVLCNRYVRKGIFYRIKNNFYVLESTLHNAPAEYFLRLSNFLQVPSYISFMTALSYYNLTTQVQRQFFESASLKRSVSYNVNEIIFGFHKLKEELFFDFSRKDDIFIATPEKAFADSVYLYSLGRYSIDLSSLDFEKFDRKHLNKIIKRFPDKTKLIIDKWMS